MRRTTTATAAIVAAVLVTACSGDEFPVSPSLNNLPTSPACQLHTTALITLHNASSVATIAWYWNTVTLGVTGPGQQLENRVVAANVPNRMEGRLADSARVLCTAQPVFAACSTQTLNCSD